MTRVLHRGAGHPLLYWSEPALAPVMPPGPKEPRTSSRHKASAEAVVRVATEPASTKAPASVMKRRATEAEQRLRKERGALRRGFGAAIANM